MSDWIYGRIVGKEEGKRFDGKIIGHYFYEEVYFSGDLTWKPVPAGETGSCYEWNGSNANFHLSKPVVQIHSVCGETLKVFTVNAFSSDPALREVV